MLLYFQPCLYTEVSEAWFLPPRRRLWIDLAGILWNLFALGALLILWLFIPVEWGSVLLLCAGLLTFATVLNLNPLLPFDGYYALMDVLGKPNLRNDAFAALLDVVQRRPVEARRGPSSRWYLAFGIAAVIYTVITLLVVAYIVVSLVGPIFGGACILALTSLRLGSLRLNRLRNGWRGRIPRNPIVKPGVLGMTLPDGDIEIGRTTEQSIRLAGESGLTRQMLAGLDGRPLKEVASSLGVRSGRLRYLLRPLAWSGLLERGPSPELRRAVPERFSRSISFISTLGADRAWDAHARMRRATVALFGNPDWAHWTALHLFGAGVGRVLVVGGETAGAGLHGPPFSAGWLKQFRPDGVLELADASEVIRLRPDLIVALGGAERTLCEARSGDGLPGFVIRAELGGATLTPLCDAATSPADRSAKTPMEDASLLRLGGIAGLEAVRALVGGKLPRGAVCRPI